MSASEAEAAAMHADGPGHASVHSKVDLTAHGHRQHAHQCLLSAGPCCAPMDVSHSTEGALSYRLTTISAKTCDTDLDLDEREFPTYHQQPQQRQRGKRAVEESGSSAATSTSPSAELDTGAGTAIGTEGDLEEETTPSPNDDLIPNQDSDWAASPLNGLGGSHRCVVLDTQTASLAEVVVEGDWTRVDCAEGVRCVEGGFVHDNADQASKGSSSIRFQPQNLAAGEYRVLFAFTASLSRANNVPVVVRDMDGLSTTLVDQQDADLLAAGNGWVDLGVYDLDAAHASVTVGTAGTDGKVVVDAMAFCLELVPTSSPTPAPTLGSCDPGLELTVDAQSNSTSAVVLGAWSPVDCSSTPGRNCLGGSFLSDDGEGKGLKSVLFLPPVSQEGLYRVEVLYTSSTTRDASVPVSIQHADGVSGFLLNQQINAAELGGGDGWLHVATFFFTPGRSAVLLSNTDTTRKVVVDAVRLVCESASAAAAGKTGIVGISLNVRGGDDDDSELVSMPFLPNGTPAAAVLATLAALVLLLAVVAFFAVRRRRARAQAVAGGAAVPSGPVYDNVNAADGTPITGAGANGRPAGQGQYDNLEPAGGVAVDADGELEGGGFAAGGEQPFVYDNMRSGSELEPIEAPDRDDNLGDVDGMEVSSDRTYDQLMLGSASSTMDLDHAGAAAESETDFATREPASLDID